MVAPIAPGNGPPEKPTKLLAHTWHVPLQLQLYVVDEPANPAKQLTMQIKNFVRNAQVAAIEHAYIMFESNPEVTAMNEKSGMLHDANLPCI